MRVLHCDSVPVQVHRLGRVIFVRALSVPAETLTEPVGSQEVGAGEARHLCRPGLTRHSGVEILTFRQHYSPLGGSLTEIQIPPEQQFWCPDPS